MTDLRGILEKRAERGQPRGASAVFERADAGTVVALQHAKRMTRRTHARGLALGVAAMTVAVAALAAIGIASRRDAPPIQATRASTDRLVVLTPDFRVLLTDRSGRRLRTLAKDWGVRRGTPAMSVSPDGSTLYMDRDRPIREGECTRRLVEEIVAIPLEGDGGVRVVAQGRWPAVSPDGSALAYAAPLDSGGACGDPTGVVVRDLATGAERRWSLPGAAAEADDYVAYLSWAPDSRHLGFAEFSTKTRVRVLDTKRRGALSDAPVTPLASDLSWAGYLGATGQFLVVQKPAGSDQQASIVAVDPTTGRVTRKLLRFEKQLSDGNTKDQINEGVAADGTGKTLLITAARHARETGNTLYRWSDRDRRVRPIGRSAAAAVWAPNLDCRPRTRQAAGACDRSRRRPTTTAQVANRLAAAGHSVTRDRSLRTPSGFLGAEPTILCADHQSVQVYEYASLAEREVQSNAIQPDGSLRYRDGTNARSVIPEWRASPHVFATGRLIVVYVGDDASLVRSLDAALGPAIPANARGRGAVGPRC